MPGMELGLKLDDSHVKDLFERAPEIVVRRVGQIVEGAAIDTQREMRIQAPVAVTGDLRRSIRYIYSLRTLTARVLPEVTYAEDVEYGTPPHHESVAEGTSLRKWADLKGIDPYALQAKIEEKGTMPHPFVKDTYVKMRPLIEQGFATGVDRLVKDLDSGRL